MRKVSSFQRVVILVKTGVRQGACEFCPWIGDEEFEASPVGRAEAEEASRDHLGEQHPEKVTYWAEKPK